MDALRVWNRMLWKAFREGWPVLLIAIALPLLLLLQPLPTSENPHVTDYHYIGVSLASILVTLWAVELARSMGTGVKTRQALPLPAATRWAFTYLIPAIIPALSGLAVGLLVSKFNTTGAPHASLINGSIIFMLANFALCAMLAQTIAPLPAVMAGLVLLFLGYDEVELAARIPLFTAIIVGSVLASLPWAYFASRQRYLPGRMFALAVFIGAYIASVSMLYPSVDRGDMVKQPAPRPMTSSHSEDIYYYDEQTKTRYSVGWDKQQVYHSTRHPDRPGVWMTAEREVAPHFEPLLFLDNTHILIAQQKAGEEILRFLEWDVTENRVRERVAMAIGKDLLQGITAAQISPDQRFLLMGMQSRIGKGNDLWLLDLQHKRARLVLPNVYDTAWGYSDGSLAWQGDRRVILSGAQAIAIDLVAMRAEVLDLTPRRATR